MTENATPFRAGIYGRNSQGQDKPVDDQISIATSVIAEHAWGHAGTFDDGTSASRYATKARPGWADLLTEITASRLDVLVLWDFYRGTRSLDETAVLLNACREHGVLIYLISAERLFDPRRAMDYRDLAREGIDGAFYSDKLSADVQRGLTKAARKGRPAQGKVPYGYTRRRWQEPNPETGKLVHHVAQEPDPETAPVVRRVFAEVLAHRPLAAIARGLVADQVPPPPRRNDGGQPAWSRDRVRDLIRREAYAGYRVYRRQGRNGNGQGERLAGDWTAIVTPETWHAAQAVLDGPGRRTSPRAGQKHLLSMIAECSNGHPLTVKKGRRYQCQPGCVGVRKADLDDLVEATVVEALATPAVYRRLRQAGETSDAEVQTARDEAATLRARLGDYRARARAGTVDADDFADISAGLKTDIAAADARAEQAGLPPALRPFTDPGVDVEARWDAATLQARREIIRALVTVTVKPCGRNPRTPVADRVDVEPVSTNAA